MQKNLKADVRYTEQTKVLLCSVSQQEGSLRTSISVKTLNLSFLKINSNQNDKNIIMIKFIDPNSPVKIDRIVTVIYGPPNCGKTTLASMASRPFNLDIERGIHRSYQRIASANIDKFSDIFELSANNFANYDTIIIDTLGALIDACIDELLKDPKNGSDGALSLKGYGKLKSRMAGVHRHLFSLGKDLVYLAHVKEKSGNDGKTVYKLDATGTFPADLVKSAELMGRISMHGEQPVVKFVPDDLGEAKIPRSLGIVELPIPHYLEKRNFLADIIRDTKDALSSLSEERSVLAEEQSSISSRLETIETPEELTELASSLKAEYSGKVLDVARAMVLKKAKELGCAWDNTTSTFVLEKKQ